MKKLLFVSFIPVLITIACGKKTVATKDVAVNTSEISSAETLKSNAEVADASLLAAGKTIYETKCTRCHGMKPTISYSSERWDSILKLMASKSKLTETETQQVTAYVKANAKR